MSDKNYYEEGKEFQKAERYGEAFVLYQQGADKDDAQCWYAIGNCYLDGTGVEADIGKAIEAYEMASELGSAEAECALGGLYEDGWYVPEDFSRATFWLKKAAERGHAAAQYRLGEIYQTWSMEEDCVEKAVYWYTKAMAQGNTDARMSLGLLYLTDEKFFNYEKANECLNDIADDLNATVQWFIGDLYYHESSCRKQDYMLRRNKHI